MTMKLATVKCFNPSCSTIYEIALYENEWHAKCPVCGQKNRVPGQSMGKEITGLCDSCKRPLDDGHIFGRETFCCPPQSK